MLPAYQRTIAAEVEGLRQIHTDLLDFFGAQNVPPKASHDAQLVCEELIVNAIRHGLGSEAGADHRIDLSITLGHVITIRIRDDLPLFDPTTVPGSAPARSLATAPVGGRGLAMVRRVATQFRWRAESGRNVVDLEVPIEPR